MTKTFIVYQLRASDEERPFYIGKTHKGSNREGEHRARAEAGGRKTRVYGKMVSISKRGARALFEVLLETETERYALSEEVRLIKEYGRVSDGGILTNLTVGGEGVSGLVMTEESKRKMSGRRLEYHRNGGPINGAKTVSVFTLEGGFLSTWSTIKGAERGLNLPDGVIGNYLNHPGRRAVDGKYRFRFGADTDPLPPLKPLTAPNSSIVSAFSVDGKFISTYPTQREAASALGVPRMRIAKVVGTSALTVVGASGEYRFRAGSETSDLPPRPSTTRGVRRRVGQYSLDGELIQIFRSLSEASRETGLGLTGIQEAASGVLRKSQGFLWTYAEDKDP